MRTTIAAKLAVMALLIAVLAANIGCDTVRGGADIYIEGVSITSVSIEGKPVTGLPSQKVDLLLKVGTNKVTVSQSGGNTILKCSPSGATITSGPDGIIFTGVAADKVEILWQSTGTGQ
jgi:hypothetical protein